MKAPADKGARKRQQRTARLSESPGSGETTLAKIFKKTPTAKSAQASFNKSEYSSVSDRLRKAIEKQRIVPPMVRIVSFSCCAEAKLIRFSCAMQFPSLLVSGLRGARFWSVLFNRIQHSGYVQTYFWERGTERRCGEEKKGGKWYPRRGSNSRLRLRRPALYPLSYRGTHQAKNIMVGLARQPR